MYVCMYVVLVRVCACVVCTQTHIRTACAVSFCTVVTRSVVCMHVCSVAFSSPDCSVHSIPLWLLLCRDIMLLSNTVIYDHQLQAGSSTVAMATLNVPHWSSTSLSQSEMTDGPSVGVRGAGLPHWLLYALDPSHPVVFVDTDKVTGWKKGRRICTTALPPSSTWLYMTGCLASVLPLRSVFFTSQLLPPILYLSPILCSSLFTIVHLYQLCTQRSTVYVCMYTPWISSCPPL